MMLFIGLIPGVSSLLSAVPGSVSKRLVKVKRAALAGVTDHELFHATDQQNIHDSLSNSSNDVEVGPFAREIGILKVAVVKDVMNIAKLFIR